MAIKLYKMCPLNQKFRKIQSVRIPTKKKGSTPLEKLTFNFKFYFLKIALFTPACSHFLIVGLRNDIGRAVKTANETTRIKSVVKWFIPRSVPASHSQGKAEANNTVSINSHQFRQSI